MNADLVLAIAIACVRTCNAEFFFVTVFRCHSVQRKWRESRSNEAKTWVLSPAKCVNLLQFFATTGSALFAHSLAKLGTS